MALVWKDRVLETTTTTGTGTLTLAGAVTGYQTFAAVGDGNTCYFCIYAVDAFGNPSGVWEVGFGTYTASGTTLARTTVYANSSGTQVALDLAAGTKRVMLTAAAQHLTTIPVVNGGTGLTALGSALQVLRTNAGATAAEWATISTGLTVGTTAIASGTSGRLLYDDGGVVGETAAVTYATSTANLTVTASGAAVVPLVVNGATSQTARLLELRDSADAVVVGWSATGAVQTMPQSFAIGDSATVTGTGTGRGAVAIGYQAGATAATDYAACVAIGESSQASARGVAIGFDSTSNGSGVAIGWGATISGTNGVAVGQSAVSSGGVALGDGVTSGAGGSFAVGQYHTVTSGGCAIGSGVTSGNGDFGINPRTWFVGRGTNVNVYTFSSTTVRELWTAVGGWVGGVDTDATRKATVAFDVYDTAARECIRLEASGSAAMLGLYGTAATVQYATTGTVTGYTGGGGTALTHSDTFTGNTGSTAYTLGDVVRALKLLGVIAA